MSGYIIVNYQVDNPQGYEPYVPAVIPTLAKHQCEILVADYESKALEGEPAQVTVVLKFPSVEAAQAWYDSPEYKEIIHHRTNNSSKAVAMLCKEFVMPAG